MRDYSLFNPADSALDIRQLSAVVSDAILDRAANELMREVSARSYSVIRRAIGFMSLSLLDQGLKARLQELEDA